MNIEKDILYRFFNGEATVSEEKEVRAYIESSPDNWKHYLSERRLYDTVILRNSTIGSERRQLRRHRARRIAFQCMKIAALLAIAFSTAFFWLGRNHPAAGTNIVSTLQGQMANVVLPDGTRVWLNSKTTLEYPTTFDYDKRKVQIDGEAYFEVIADKEHPFVVQTSRTQVEVLGTKFYVEDYSNANRVETALIEGSVSITAGKKTLMLQPSHKAVWRDGTMRIEPITDFDVYRWREGLICFKRRRFTEILKEFEKYYGTTIIIDTVDVDNPLITAKFRLADGIEYALRVLQKDVMFHYIRDDDKNTMVIK